jgi:hypothetical protein
VFIFKRRWLITIVKGNRGRNYRILVSKSSFNITPLNAAQLSELNVNQREVKQNHKESKCRSGVLRANTRSEKHRMDTSCLSSTSSPNLRDGVELNLV